MRSAAPGAERAARGGEHECAHVLASLAGERLEDRAVLAVDGQQRHAAARAPRAAPARPPSPALPCSRARRRGRRGSPRASARGRPRRPAPETTQIRGRSRPRSSPARRPRCAARRRRAVRAARSRAAASATETSAGRKRRTCSASFSMLRPPRAPHLRSARGTRPRLRASARRSLPVLPSSAIRFTAAPEARFGRSRTCALVRPKRRSRCW